MAADDRLPDSDVDLNKWKNRTFPRGSRARAGFEYLCLRGCNPRGLLSFLEVAVFNSQTQRSVYDTFEVSQSELVDLPDKLEQISRDLESFNPILAGFLGAVLMENPLLSDEIRSRCRQQIAVYRRTPDLLRLLSTHLRWANQWLKENVGPKRYDSFRQSVLGLLSYVDECTKSPHYQEVADLLDHLYSARQKNLQGVAEFTPGPKRPRGSKKKVATARKLLSSPDALKALYLRSVKYGFRQPRPSELD